MKLSTASLLILGAGSSNAAFIPSFGRSSSAASKVVVKGYLDDLSSELYAPDENPDIEGTSREETNAEADEKANYGASDWSKYVEFDEFDGGDGQMGVAGDGNKGLEKFGSDQQPQLAKSKAMSAKNAWGTNTGYADKLLSEKPKLDVARAQQLENWMNQQEVRNKQLAQKALTDSFDQVTAGADEDWRTLAKFGVERNEEFDMDEEFGPVAPGDTLEGTIELSSSINRAEVYEFPLKNQFMGFADFRAAFTPETPMDWTVEPNEGSLMSKEATNFLVKFRPQNPGTTEGFLVIETEDFKKTWKVIGSTA